MHNWEHYGRLPAYFLMAALVASCGGGSDLSLNGQSTVTVKSAPAKVQLGVKDSKEFEVAFVNSDGSPLVGEVVTASITSSSGVASLTTLSTKTNANGLALFTLKSTELPSQGNVTVTYVDKNNNITRQSLEYVVIDGTGLESMYAIVPTSTDIVIPTSGKTEATISVVIKDENGKAVSQGKVVSLALSSNASQGRLKAASATTSSTGQIDAVVDGLNQLAGDNALIVTYVDPLGSTVSRLIPFKIVNKFEVLLTASNSVLKTGRDSVVLTATVFNASQSLVKNAKVSFKVLSNEPTLRGERCSQKAEDLSPTPLIPANRGTLNKNDIFTDDNGQATTTFNVTDNNNGARRIMVSVASDSSVDIPTDCVDVTLSGTTLVVEPASINTTVGSVDPTKITATVTNGIGLPVKGVNVDFKGTGVTPLSLTTKSTDDTGKASLVNQLVFAENGIGTVTASAANVPTNQNINNKTSVTVSPVGQRIFFVDTSNVPITSNEAPINANNVVVKLTKQRDPGKKVKFVTTLGTISSTEDSLDDGEVSANITSTSPGLARVDVVQIGTPSVILGHGDFTFVSKTPERMTLQSNQATLKPKGQALIEAEVLDSGDHPVKDALVEFNLLNDPSNGDLSSSVALTDANGKASVLFTAGTLDTAKDAVKVSAVIHREGLSDVTPTNGSVKLTVGGQALFISIATGKNLLVVDDTTYALPLSVAVTDAVGHPVSDSNVSVQVIPKNYIRGIYFFNTVAKVWQTAATDPTIVSEGAASIDLALFVPPATCINEDVNSNGILDAVEDANKDGVLTPGNPVTILGSLVTNTAGRAAFTVQYGKSYANWLEVDVIASTEVSGSESVTKRTFLLPALAEDIKEVTVSPPGGVISPYGRPSIVNVQQKNGSAYKTTNVLVTSSANRYSVPMSTVDAAAAAGTPLTAITTPLNPCTNSTFEVFYSN